MSEERTFPLKMSRKTEPGPLSIPWSVAEIAYGGYLQKFGYCQPLERVYRRGGFYWSEMDEFYPGWRKQVDALEALKRDITQYAKINKDILDINDQLSQRNDELEDAVVRFRDFIIEEFSLGSLEACHDGHPVERDARDIWDYLHEIGNFDQENNKNG